MPPAVAGFVAFGLAVRLLGDDAERGELEAVLRGLPHNVTTERTSRSGMPRPGSRPTARRRRWFATPARPSSRDGTARAHCPTSSSESSRTSSPGTATARSPRSTSACRAGPTNPRTCSAHWATTRGGTTPSSLPTSSSPERSPPPRRRYDDWSPRHAVGDELVSTGRLVEAQDVVFLDFAEMRAALDGVDQRRLVRERRERYAHELRRRHVPRVFLYDGTEPERARPAEDGAITGTPASSGVVTARVRILLDPEGARLEPGEVLVAPSTDQGWTPLFLTAGGLVMEKGGANSHGAVVAREYKIPAVVGVAHATETIENGARITVDRSSGTITIG